MNRVLALACIAGLMLGIAAGAANARSGVRVGVLSCNVHGGVGWIIGSTKTANCIFRSSHDGWRDYYVGSITRVGIDVGVTNGSKLVWAVFAPGRGLCGCRSGGDNRSRDRSQCADRRLQAIDQFAARERAGTNRTQYRRRHRFAHTEAAVGPLSSFRRKPLIQLKHAEESWTPTFVGVTIRMLFTDFPRRPANRLAQPATMSAEFDHGAAPGDPSEGRSSCGTMT